MLTKLELKELRDTYTKSLNEKLRLLSEDKEMSAAEKAKALNLLKLNAKNLQLEYNERVTEVFTYFKNLLCEYVSEKEFTTLKKKTVEVPAVWLTGLRSALYRYEVTMNSTYSLERELKDTLDKEAKINESKRLREANELRLKLKAKFVELLNEAEPNKLYDMLSLEQLENMYSELLVKKNLGKTFEFGQCEYCDEYTLGEHRCSCGNRRVSAYYEFYTLNGELSPSLTLEAY